MYNHSASVSPDAPLPVRTAAAQRGIECDRSANEHIRELLRCFGLRTSLIRFKVIDALLVAARDGRAIGVRGVHAHVESFVAELSFLSVRGVLNRLCSERLIRFHSDKSYSFTAEARAILDKHTGC